MIRCSDCSWLFHHRLLVVTANIQANNVVLTEGDRLEDTLLKMGGGGGEGEETRAEKETTERKKN